MSSRRPDELCGRVPGGGAVGCLSAEAAVSDIGSGMRSARCSADDNAGDILASSSDISEQASAAVCVGELGELGRLGS